MSEVRPESGTYRQQVEASVAAVASVGDHLDTLEGVAQMLIAVLRGGGKLLTCGNGGSAAEAQHFAEEMVGRYCRERPALPALSLGADSALMTCIINDYGADELFARQVSAFGNHGDVLIVLSTSGNSENVVRALQCAHSMGLITVALLGRDGGRCKGMAQHEIIIAGEFSARIQEAHLLCIHVLCEAIDVAFA